MTLDEVIADATVINQTVGFSLNVIDSSHQQVVNVEIYEDTSTITSFSLNGSHFNMYKYLAVPPVQHVGTSNDRQSNVNMFQVPATTKDLAIILGDTKEPGPIYNSDTLMTVIFDAGTPYFRHPKYLF